MSIENTNLLAEKIARLLDSDTPNVDLRVLQESLEKISDRLDKLERNAQNTNNTGSQFAELRPKNHPSRERFEIADVFAKPTAEDLGTEKPCIFEPNGKPCDYCSMCSARGF